MDLSIIIVNWNTRDLLARCLQSVYDTAGDLDFEIFVVDNASTDGSAEMVRNSFPQVQLIENAENVGFARANNQAMKQSEGKCILLLNSDTMVKPGSLEAMVAFMESHPDTGALGCQLLNGDGSLQGSFADFPSLWSAWLGTDFRRHRRIHEKTEAFEVDAVSGACLMARREVLQTVGYMDESYKFFAEEVDWCYRIRKAGWRIRWLPTAQVVHFLGQSRKSRPGFAYLHIHRSRLLFFRKHYGPVQARILWLGYIGVATLKLMGASVGSLLHRGNELRARLAQNRNLLRWLLLEEDVFRSRGQAETDC